MAIGSMRRRGTQRVATFCLITLGLVRLLLSALRCLHILAKFHQNLVRMIAQLSRRNMGNVLK